MDHDLRVYWPSCHQELQVTSFPPLPPMPPLPPLPPLNRIHIPACPVCDQPEIAPHDHTYRRPWWLRTLRWIAS